MQNNIIENAQMTEKTLPENYQKVVIQNVVQESNWLWTAWFVLAVINLFTFWVPVIGQIWWVLAFLFSFIWVFKKPRWLAITWLIISLIDLIILIIIFYGILWFRSFF